MVDNSLLFRYFDDDDVSEKKVYFIIIVIQLNALIILANASKNK